ncbi:MAG: hypothetical protein GKR97_09850 [Rhizobiaceae bacterium]|nr:hypothetical protein [Rhizobiaceae bacterium]
MTMRMAEFWMGIALLCGSLGLMWSIHSDGLSIEWIEGRGPGAGVWPFWLSAGMALTCLWTLVRWFRKATSESRDLTHYIDPDSIGLVATSFFSLTAMLILVGIVGSYVSIALFLGFYMRVVGKHSWKIVWSFVIGGPIFIYFLFEWQLSKYLPKGWPIFEEAFLWLDNYRWEYLM